MSKRIRSLTTLRNVALLFATMLVVAVGIQAAENYTTGGRWACTGSCTVPDGGNSSQVTSLTLGSTGTTSVDFGANVTSFTIPTGATITFTDGLITGANDETLSIGGTDSNLIFTTDGTETARISGADAAGASNTVYDTTGAGTVTMGSADVTAVIGVTDGAGLNLEGTTANTLTLTAATTGTAIFQGADAASPANTLLDTTGAGTVTLGSADVTAVIGVTDGAGLNLEGTTANTLTLSAATTGTATFQGADAAGAANTALDTTGAGTITIGSADVTSISMDTDGADLALDVTGNALTVTATTTASPTFIGADAAAEADTVLDTTGAGTITIGSADVTNVTIDSDVGLTLANAESLNSGTDSTFDFTRDDSGIVTITCSDDDATAGCTYDAGGASPIVVGSADVTTLNLTNNGAMTLGASTSDSMTLIATGAFDIGNNVATAVTIDTDGTGDGELVLPTESVAAGEITNLTRTVSLSLNDFWPCNADGTLESDDAADAFPDFARGSGGATAGSHTIQWDITGGSADTEEVCVTVNVPQDYVSGSAFYITFLDTATNDHVYDETTLVQTPDGAEDTATAAPTLSNGVGASTTTTTCDGATTASDLYTCIWTTEAVTAGATIVFGIGPTAADTEALTMFGAEWRYTATQ
jgi:hypothetical protein